MGSKTHPPYPPEFRAEALDLVRELVRELPQDGTDKPWALEQRSRGAAPPCPGEVTSIEYRMRLFALHMLETWPKLCLAQTRPDLGMDGTNNATERAIGKSKMRYKTMRGYKSLAMAGRRNGIALTQWLYTGDANHDLAPAMAACAEGPPGACALRNSPTACRTVTPTTHH